MTKSLTYGHVVDAVSTAPEPFRYSRTAAFLWAQRYGILKAVRMFQLANVPVDELVVLLPARWFDRDYETIYGLPVETYNVPTLMIASAVQLQSVQS